MFRPNHDRKLGRVIAPDEKQIRITYSALAQYVDITERNDLPLDALEVLSLALSWAQGTLIKLAELHRGKLCSKCGAEIGGGGGSDGGKKE